MNVWDRPSNSCLASRIPWGVQVTAERLIRIELAEKVVKNSTGARQVRVRDIDGAARIEVGAEDMEKILNFDTAKMLDEPLRMRYISYCRSWWICPKQFVDAVIDLSDGNPMRCAQKF